MAKVTYTDESKKAFADAYKKSLQSGMSSKDAIKANISLLKKQKNNNTNYTPYTNLTNKTPTQNTNPGGKGTDLSYVKPTNYYGSGVDWDYSADISKDKNRAKQMAYNLKSDMKSNPGLFQSRSDYDKYYNYSNRSASQKAMLDEFFDNANKYGLGSTDNFYADMASEASTDKNRKKLAKAADTYNKSIPYLNEIRQKLDDRLGPVFDKLMDSQTKYLNDMAELRKLQRQYYKGMTEEANSRAAGQAASMGSMMSGQGLSQSSIASSMFGAEKAWVSELNNIQAQHIKTMQDLSDSEGTFMNNRAGVMNNLTSTEQAYLNNWYNSFKTLQDNYDKVYNTMIDEQYSPYEVLTQAKVSGAAETLQSTGKVDVKQSEYQGANSTKKRSIIYNQLYGLLSSDPTTFAKFTPYITTAVEQYPHDWEKAVTYVLEKGGVKQGTAIKVIEKIVDGGGGEGGGEGGGGGGGGNNYDDASNIISILGLKK